MIRTDWGIFAVDRAYWRAFIREKKPACFALYACGWRSGFTVNGMAP